MNIEDEIDRLEKCIEQVRLDFKPKFDALHEKSWERMTPRYPEAVRNRARKDYLWAYLDLCGSMMRAIQVYADPQRELKIRRGRESDKSSQKEVSGE